MHSRDHMSHLASTTYDQDDEPAEEHPSLATLGLRLLTILFGLFVLLPLVLFSPVALLVCAVVCHEREQPVIETLDEQPESSQQYPSVVPAFIEELAVELIAG